MENTTMENRSKKLYEVCLYAVDEDGVVVDAKEPKWVLDVTLDRVKARALSNKLDNDDGLIWHVKVLRTVNF